MPVKVVQLHGLGDVFFSRNIRSKRVRLSVRPDSRILVSYPPYVAYAEARNFALKHSAWIIRQQQQLSLKARKSFSGFPLKTRFHTVNIQPEGERFAVRQKKFEITLLYPMDIDAEDPRIPEYLERILTGIYAWEARKYLPSRIQELALFHGIRYNRIAIRNNRSRWGSCSSANNISLNASLMKLPDHLIDFVLLHELAHIREKNHSAAFWSHLNALSNGEAKRLRAELKNYALC